LGSLHRCTTRITLYSLVIKKWVLKQLLPSWDFFFFKLSCSRVVREQNCHRTINTKTKRVRISRVAYKILKIKPRYR
jgi:hypothetical protein